MELYLPYNHQIFVTWLFHSWMQERKKSANLLNTRLVKNYLFPVLISFIHYKNVAIISLFVINWNSPSNLYNHNDIFQNLYFYGISFFYTLKMAFHTILSYSILVLDSPKLFLNLYMSAVPLRPSLSFAARIRPSRKAWFTVYTSIKQEHFDFDWYTPPLSLGVNSYIERIHANANRFAYIPPKHYARNRTTATMRPHNVLVGHLLRSSFVLPHALWQMANMLSPVPRKSASLGT